MASKNIGDYLGAKGDNPTQAILDDLFINKGSSAKQSLKGSFPAKSYLDKLTRLREQLGLTPIDRPSHLIRETDPFQIFRRYNQFEVISSGSKEFLDLGKHLGKEAASTLQVLSSQIPELHILRKVDRITGAGQKIYGSELYIGNAGLGYTPLPVQLGKSGVASGLIQYGRSKIGAYKAGFIKNNTTIIEETFSDLFYRHAREKVLASSAGHLGHGINPKAPIVIFDLETSGAKVGNRLSIGADQEILQLFAKRIEGNVERTINMFFTPQGEIYASDIHGLTKEVLATKGAVPFAAKAKEIKQFFEGATLAGFNVAGFDIPVLQANLAKAGVQLDLGTQVVADVRDLHKAVSPKVAGSLSAAYEHHVGKPIVDAHDAAVDVAATEDVLRKILGKLGTNYEKSLASLGSEGVSQGIETLAKTLSGTSRAEATFASLKRLKNIKIGIGSKGKSVSIRELLATPAYVRGMSDTALTAMYKGNQVLALEDFLGRTGEEGEKLVSELFLRKQRFVDAKRVISQVMKSRGLSVPENIEFLSQSRLGALGQNIKASVAVREAYKVIREYNEFLPKALEAFGLGGMHPLIKPDGLIEKEKNIILPSKQSADIFGREFSDRFQKKGLHQVYKGSPITRSMARKMQNAGVRPVPYFATHSELMEGVPAFESTGTKIIGTRKPFQALVIKLKGSHGYETVFGDSGMYSTEAGLSASARRQFLGEIKIKGPTGEVLKAYETLTGRSALDTEGKLGRLEISTQEFERITKSMSLSSKERAKFLTKREKALAKLMYAPTRDLATGKIVMAPRQDFGVFRMLAERTLPGAALFNAQGRAATREAASSGAVLVSPHYSSSGVLSLRLQSIDQLAAGTTGDVLGGVRLTSAAVREGHVLGGLIHQLDNSRVKGAVGTKEARAYKVERIIGAEDVAKMSKTDVFLENFHATMQRYGLFDEFSHLLDTTGDRIKTTVSGVKYLTGSVATPADKKSALQAAGKVLKELRRRGATLHRGVSFANIAVEASKGMDVTKSVSQILGGTYLKDQILEARVVTIPGIAGRSDQKLDTNLRNRVKISLGKFKTMALGSGLLGYESPMHDPLIRDLGFQTSMFGWDHSTKDFVLHETNPIRKFLTGIAAPSSVKPEASQIVTIGQNGELLLGGKALKKLPGIEQFKTSAGGVDPRALKGTILDPELGDFFYLDLGEKRKLGLLGQGKDGKSILGEIEHRYIPIPRALLRAERGTDGRIILGKDHPAYNLIKMLTTLKAGAPAKIVNKATRAAVQSIYKKLGSKKGLLSKMQTVHLDSGFRARLAPQQFGLHDLASFGSSKKLFQGAVSREQLITAIQLREGHYLGAGATDASRAEYQRLLQQARTEKSIFTMFMADPTQRPEHMSLFELHITDKPLASSTRIKIAEMGLDIQMSPLAYKMFERDLDNDAISIMLLSGANKEYRDRIARQMRAIKPALKFFKDAAYKVKTAAEASTLGEIFAAFTGQKTFASLGYSTARPTVERLIPALFGKEGIAGLEKRGIKVKLTSTEVAEMGSFLGAGTKEFEKAYSGSVALAQYLYQSGVGKATQKGSQEALNIGLLELGEDVAARGLNVVESAKKSADLFYNFLKEQGKQRVFGAARHLEESSTPKVLEGLLQGAQKGTEEYLLRKASILMASTIGLGYATASKLGNVSGVAAFAEDENVFYSQSSMFKKIFGPLAGIFRPEVEPSSGMAGGATPGGTGQGPSKVVKAVVPEASTFAERMSSLKSEMLSGLKALTESKFFAPALIGTAALAGIGLINRATAPDLSTTASLPPPSDTSMPTDRGPALPNMKAPPRINSSNFTPSASRYRHNQQFGSVNSNFFQNRVNNHVTIDNRTSSRSNSWLIRRQMDMESESDFAY